MVGRVRVELTTSRLSGVRSNHLSYRPVPAAPSVAAKLRLMARFAALSERSACKIACAISSRGLRFQLMKGHEDGGTECSSDMEEALPLVAIRRPGRTALSAAFLRKEVIQPQVPLRLPCYDFTPVAKPTVVACLSLLS